MTPCDACCTYEQIRNHPDGGWQCACPSHPADWRHPWGEGATTEQALSEMDQGGAA